MSDSEAILLRLSRVEADLSKHAEKDEKAFKYSHNMLEDLGARLAGIERTGARFEIDLQHRNGHDTTTRKSLGGIDDRLRTLERLVWIAVGGVFVIGAIVSIVGGNIMKLLTHG